MEKTIAEIEDESEKEEVNPWEESDDQLTDFVNKNIEVMRRNLSHFFQIVLCASQFSAPNNKK